jgi:hypothetical protein
MTWPVTRSATSEGAAWAACALPAMASPAAIRLAHPLRLENTLIDLILPESGMSWQSFSL